MLYVSFLGTIYSLASLKMCSFFPLSKFKCNDISLVEFLSKDPILHNIKTITKVSRKITR